MRNLLDKFGEKYGSLAGDHFDEIFSAVQKAEDQYLASKVNKNYWDICRGVYIEEIWKLMASWNGIGSLSGYVFSLINLRMGRHFAQYREKFPIYSVLEDPEKGEDDEKN